MQNVRRTLTVGAAVLAALPAAAHHSPAMFDLTKDIVFEGTVTKVEWRNPHVYLALEVLGENGQKRVQGIEAGPASNLVTAGIDADSIRVGDRVAVHARPSRANPAGTALGWTVTTAGGATLPLHVRAAAAVPAGTATATSLAGTWVPIGTGFTSLSREAPSWPLTAAGKAAVANGRDAQAAARAACEPFGPPSLMTLPSVTVIELDAKTVTFKLDAMGAVRVVHLDQAAHPATVVPSVHGHSIGRWEGKTLVVDTKGYTAHPEGLAFDMPTSATKHVVERFTLSADGKRIEYEAVLEDPEYYAAPLRHRSEWNFRPDQKPSGLPCDLESAGRYLTEK